MRVTKGEYRGIKIKLAYYGNGLFELTSKGVEFRAVVEINKIRSAMKNLKHKIDSSMDELQGQWTNLNFGFGTSTGGNY